MSNDLNGGVIWEGADRLRTHLLPIDSLQPFPGNARKGDVPAIAESLRRFGQVRAIVTTDDGTIVAGHHVTMAAAMLDWTHIAAIPVEFESRDDARDYLVADNQLATLGTVLPDNQLTLLEEIERRGTWAGTGFTQDDLDDTRAMAVHKTELVAADELKRHRENYREHPPEQVAHLTSSLKEHGFYRNIVVAKDGTVLAGHGIVEAAREVGLKKIPVTRMNIEADSPQAMKILAGDNELAKLADVDDRELTAILKDVRDQGDLGALVGTGFDAQTLANLVMVTRPESEIDDFDAAAEWVGLPDFSPVGTRLNIVLGFDDEEARDALIAQLGLQITKKTRGSWSALWPPRPLEDLSSLRFDGGPIEEVPPCGDCGGTGVRSWTVEGADGMPRDEGEVCGTCHGEGIVPAEEDAA